MRIVSWNVNGLKSVRGYRPWYALPDWAACLELLGADMACVQEVKATRRALEGERALLAPAGWAAFADLHPQRGYSGTATYIRSTACRPRAAEPGLTGAARTPDGLALPPLAQPLACDDAIWAQLDAEGRATVVDCGLFVLFNLYCPNETDESRREYKLAYNAALAARVDALLAAGREVIVVGDLNIAREPIDHCDHAGKTPRDAYLAAHPARAWLDSWLLPAPTGRLHDVTRELFPRRAGMYTVWNTLIDARPSNYGTRLDYTLVSPGLRRWVKGADIAPDVFGSDHCPVWLDLHDELVVDGQRLVLRELLGADSGHKLPATATSNWPEFNQRNIRSFFGAPRAVAAPIASSTGAEGDVVLPQQPESAASAPSASVTPALPRSPTLADAFAALRDDSEGSTSRAMSTVAEPAASPVPSAASPVAAIAQQVPRAAAPQSIPVGSSRPSASPSPSAPRGKAAAKNNKASSKGKTAQTGQRKLMAFFGAGAGSPAKDLEVPAPQGGILPSISRSSTAVAPGAAASADENSQTASSRAPNAAELAGSTSTDAADEDEGPNTAAARVEASLAWGSIFKPPPAPRCVVHGEETRAWTVNKSGPNHGRKFYLCSRPVGPGYEREGRERIDINPEYRCDYFKWASDVRSTPGGREKGAAAGQQSLREVAGSAPRLGSGEKRSPAEAERSSSPHKRFRM